MSCLNNLINVNVNNERVEKLNNRIYNRNIPSSNLQNSFSIRPVSTKYSVMPILDMHKESSVPIKKEKLYNIEETFNPGNTQSPWCGYSVNDESTLRNQLYPLQKCDQYYWVPSSNSDLYNSRQHDNGNENQIFNNLFSKPTFNKFDPNICNIGNQLWNNNTRVQIKDVNSDCLNKCN